MIDERFPLHPDDAFDPATAIAGLADHATRLTTENAYLRRTLGMVRDVLPYADAKSGGCARARKFINEAIGGRGK